jgi:hypothetical protein
VDDIGGPRPTPTLEIFRAAFVMKVRGRSGWSNVAVGGSLRDIQASGSGILLQPPPLLPSTKSDAFGGSRAFRPADFERQGPAYGRYYQVEALSTTIASVRYRDRPELDEDAGFRENALLWRFWNTSRQTSRHGCWIAPIVAD